MSPLSHDGPSRPHKPTSRRMKGAPEGTTKDERKWVINLPTLLKPTRAQSKAVSFSFQWQDHSRLSRQIPPFKIDHNQSTPCRKAQDCGWVICRA
ncbi:hypothetical protein AVEN_27468-1 [Araneus ventricosus]|uniref:Uncharacterized protein n=1 Tax=Araneus ventricosus TaxID=182803 RepID=A0A4Y2K5X8_ARAVE|nr:hypothetical protein AVEN_27468-1 [Araneus ventricosus]